MQDKHPGLVPGRRWVANNIRLAERTGCEQCEDYGLTIDLLRPEPILTTRPIAQTGSHLDDLATTIESAIIPRLLLSHGVAEQAMNDLSSVREAAVRPEMVETFTRLVLSPIR